MTYIGVNDRSGWNVFPATTLEKKKVMWRLKKMEEVSNTSSLGSSKKNLVRGRFWTTIKVIDGL